jgi:exodeoxyribonuclease-5
MSEKRKMTIILTDEQMKAVDGAVDYVRTYLATEKPYVSVGGYAGTGKTTVLKSIIEDLDKFDCLPCAFTGKAALRMKQKGVSDAKTIHSLIYKYDKINNKFWRRPTLEGDYILIDEASMVPRDLWDDLLDYNLPIVLVGDLGQLEPVGDDPKLMSKPNFTLKTIHRQAETSGIISLATDTRIGRAEWDKTLHYKDCSVLENFDFDLMQEKDIIICGFNKTRLRINDSMRVRKNFDTMRTINKNEQIIILSNNPALGIFNGQILTIKEVVKESNDGKLIYVVATDGIEDFKLPLYAPQFGNPKSLARDGKWVKTSGGRKRWAPTVKDSKKFAFADYGYCITCHKSQGSEWDSVVVIDEQWEKAWCPKRWRYTAVTRAAKELTIVI